MKKTIIIKINAKSSKSVTDSLVFGLLAVSEYSNQLPDGIFLHFALIKQAPPRPFKEEGRSFGRSSLLRRIGTEF